MKTRLLNFLRESWPQVRENWWAAIVGCVLTAGIGWLLFSTALGQKLIFRSYDLPYAIRPNIPANEVVLVYMDEISYNALEQPLNAPWDRRLHAQLLRTLKAHGAKSVTFDIVFSDPWPDPIDGVTIDRDFASAIKENGWVVLAADNVPAELGHGQKANHLVHPYEPFEEGAASVGTAEMYPDDDLVVRQHLPESPSDPMFTLSWMTAELAGAQVTKNQTDHFRERWVNYYGPDKTLPYLSYHQVVTPGETNPADGSVQFTNSIPPGFFRDKYVFVGARTFTKFAFERKDAYPAPFPNQAQENKFMPGVEIQATIFLNLLRGDWLNRLPRSEEKTIIIAFGFLLGLGLILCRPWLAGVIAVSTGLIVIVGHYYCFTHYRFWFPWMIIVVGQIPIATFWSVLYNSLRLYVQKRLLEQSLAAYVSPKRVKQIVNREMLAPGAEKQMLTILFSDIENFTVLSEGVDSDELALLMNKYFESAVTDCIFKTDGTVVKYIGDAIFSFWNAPEEQQDHTRRACEAALMLSNQAISFEKNGQMQHFRTRVGLHTGVANVGNFGSKARIDYTALGENINLASRMEGLNKYLGTNVLITGETKEGLGDALVSRFCGKFILKGFEKAVDVHELVGRPEEAEASRAWREAYDEAWKHFQKGHFDNAEKGFRCVLEIKPNDGPAKFHLKAIEELRAEAPEADWQGEIELKEK